ncbi:MAG: TolC family protein [Methylotenera sp.]|nr:TolC family protein [Oligoflexia bacterium]
MIRHFAPRSLVIFMGTLLLILLSPVDIPSLFAAGNAPSAAANVTADTKSLDEVFAAAVQHSEIAQIQGELETQTLERYKQARGSIFPSLNLNASYFRQEDVNSVISRNVSPSSQTNVRLTAQQPLFRGFREFAFLRQSRKLSEAQEQLKQQALLQLYQEVAQNYLTILSVEQDLKNIRSELDLYEDNIKELNRRVKIGRSRLNDSLTLQSAEAQLLANQDLVRGQLKSARQALTYLTSFDENTLLKPLDLTISSKQSVEKYLSTLENRPDIKAGVLQTEAADEAVTGARGAHLPSADLTANYYLKHSGVSAASDWDATLGLTLPIFAGGTIQSQVRTAISQRRVAELQTASNRRLAERDVRVFHEQLMADEAQVESLDRTQSLFERNYLQTRKDYGLGLTTNIDVLNSLQSYRLSRRTLDRARVNVQLDLIQLEIVSGKRSAQIAQASSSSS